MPLAADPVARLKARLKCGEHRFGVAAHLVGRYLPIEQIGGVPIPGILPGAAAMMLMVGMLAALGPARRGLRIDPTEALRSEQATRFFYCAFSQPTCNAAV